MKKHCVALLIMVFIVMLLAGCGGGGGGSDSSLSSAKAITAFSFTSPAATGTIDENAKTITVTVPFGTNVTALVATLTTTGASVKVGSTVQVSGQTPNDFTNPVSYVVTAADSSTAPYAVTVNIAARPADAQWAQTVTTGSSSSDFYSVSVASDGSGSVYAAGTIFGNVTHVFGNSVSATGTYSGGVNIVLVKYNSSGVAQWARTVTAGNSNSYFYSVSVASDGSVYAAGYISGIGLYNFGNNVTATGTNSTGYNIVLVKYNSNGDAQWARTVTAGSSNSLFNSVSVASDGSGSVYAAGFISGAVPYNFGTNITPITATGKYSSGGNIVLVKYASDGVAQWARTVTAGSSASSFNSVSVASDGSGSVYAAGTIDGADTYNFGTTTTPITATGKNISDNIVLVKYASDGVAQWARTVTAGSSDSSFNSVSVASDGSVYAVGYISETGPYNFGNNVTATGTYSNGFGSGYNIVLVKYTSDGLTQWARTVTAGNYYSVFLGVSVASDGSVYTAGYIAGAGPYNFGNSVTATGTYKDYNIVLVKYNSSGVAQWAQTETGGSNASVFLGVSVASDGSVYSAGVIGGTGTYDFGNNVTAKGTSINDNIVLVKYH